MDAYSNEYPSSSPYSANGNSPIMMIDIDGNNITLYAEINGKCVPLIVIVTSKINVSYCLDQAMMFMFPPVDEDRMVKNEAIWATYELPSFAVETFEFYLKVFTSKFQAVTFDIGGEVVMFTGVAGSGTIALFLTQDNPGEIHMYLNSSAPFDNFGFSAGLSGQFGVAEFEATESNPNPTPESMEGTSWKWSIAVGVAGASGTLPTPSQGQYEGNPWHSQGGWTTTSAGPSYGAEGGIYGGVVQTEHLGRLLECECADTNFDD